MHASSVKAKKKAKEDLIPSVWRQFPAELLEKVLTKLSVSTLKTFRRVCKQWKVLIESEAFALKCDSVESTLFAVQWSRYVALPNVTTDCWDKHDLEFLSKGEDALFLAADQGLLLYHVYKPEDRLAHGIFLIVQNCLSCKWRRLGVPFKTERGHTMYVQELQASLLGGLQVDPGTGNFKVVVAFITCHTNWNTFRTPRDTFIYDSSSNSWTVSGTEAPVLGRPQLRHPSSSYWLTGTRIYYGREFYWLDQLFMANLYDSKEKILLPPEFSHLAPDMEMFDLGSAQRLLERVGDRCFDSDFKPVKCFAEGGNWFLLSEAAPGFVDILFVSNRGPVTPLPRLQYDIHNTCRSPLMSFGTFPASWRLSRKIDSQLACR
ncbi:hypothetical protein R1sor_006320 [Riccia sorocarpa]|uniref:F-box domain-containing protein n=1 Tax=Riccia sorocarpa TaxID=122646 RepID=A0ABD3HQQ8_9MARC